MPPRFVPFASSTPVPVSTARVRARPIATGPLVLRLGVLALTPWLLTWVACASGGGPSRQEVLNDVALVGTLDARLGNAQTEGLDLLAPRGVEAAQQALNQAINSAQRGQTADAQRLAQQGLDRLDRAVEESKRSADALREVLDRRARAVAAGAPDLLPERFEELDEQLRAAARMAEQGEIEEAKDAGPALLKGYSAVELASLKVDATELARDAIDQAKKAEADEYANKTFGRAKKELEIALGILETDRSETARANVHARRAAMLAARSQHAGELVKEFDRRDYDREDIVLWYQEQLETLLKPLGGETDFTKPNHEVIAGGRTQLESLVDAHIETEAQLATALARIEELELSSTLSAADQRAAEARYDRIQAMFSEDEATVYRQGQNVLLETYGFQFPVGQSEIQSDNFPLLRKIEAAIGEFSNPDVVVSGHTDSTGNDALNQTLSEDRARKVANFLVQVGGLDRSRVQSRGYGESKPVASNETETGRARNRRIEILIVNR